MMHWRCDGRGMSSEAEAPGTPSAVCDLPYANRMSPLKSVLSRLVAVRERGNITRRSASRVRSDHDASAGLPWAAEAVGHQPVIVDQ
jgi:hypothetical protein